jgi:putative membrane protein
MVDNAIMAGLHHVFAFAVAACVVYEFVAFRKGLGVAEARRIQRVDRMYGIAAGLVLVVGLLRVFYFEKGSGYYFGNTIFWVKMALFAAVGLLSIGPTRRFIRWNADLGQSRPPEIPDDEYRVIRRVLVLELIGIFLILFAAPMMARGLG